METPLLILSTASIEKMFQELRQLFEASKTPGEFRDKYPHLFNLFYLAAMSDIVETSSQS